MSVLWRKFSKDTNIPQFMAEPQRAAFEHLFASGASAWICAIEDLGLSMRFSPQRPILWHAGLPYINWSAVTRLVSGGVVDVARGAQGEIVYKTNYKLARLWALLRAQWTVSRYIAPRLADGCALPRDEEAQLCESLALGLAILSLMLRLPEHDEAQMASWLAMPEQAPARARRTILQIETLQRRRTLLSPAWAGLFPDEGNGAVTADVPEYFWDTPPAAKEPFHKARTAPKEAWKGLPVCPGARSGKVVLLRGRKDDAELVSAAGDEALILVFPRARPDAVEFYTRAAAVLFIEGGALAHACVVARECHLPCVTALGGAFRNDMEVLATQGPVFLHVDGATGMVRHAKTPR
jgi:phosphohistidine swiveling domain-containing protein